MLRRERQFHMVIPEGTKVLISLTGQVGIVIESPIVREYAYRIRFTDGHEESFRRSELSIFKHVQAEAPGAVDSTDLYRFVVYRCVVGSTAYGLSQEDSDIDRRGFYLPPGELEWSLAGVPEQLETDNEEVYWEIGKFIRLALKANPNVLECLYSPIVETCAPIARDVIDTRHIFLSKFAHRTYNAYVLSQFKKLEQDLRNRGEIRWKHVMHLIRLLLSGVAILKHGSVPLRADEHRDRLLAIRKGEVPWDEVERWRLSLHRELDDALACTRLPDQPDYRRANDLLIAARRLAASPDYGQ